MTERRFWVETELSPLDEGDVVELSGAQKRHAERVLRLRDGDEVMLFDGRGTRAEAALEVGGARLKTVVHEERPHPEIVLLQALCKPQTADHVVRFATELGAARVVFFESARSSPTSVWNKRSARFERISRESSRQCERLYLPELRCVRSLDAAIGSLPDAGDRIAGAARMAERESSAFTSFSGAHRAVVIGPEGGFDNDELHVIERSGFEFIRLAAQVLRVDTAVAAMLARVQ